MLGGIKAHAVGLYWVDVADGGLKRDIAYRIGLAFLQDLDSVQKISQVGEDNRLGLKGVSRGKQPTSRLEATPGHGLNHNIDVCRVVKMAMGEDYSAELIGFELPLGGLDNAPRAGVNQYLSTA